MRRSIGWVVLLAATLAACGTERHGEAAVVVDSVVPMADALERFREGLEAPTGLQGGAASADDLVRELVRLTATIDTAAIERLALSRAEFGYLYFPSSPLAGAPYELPPDLAWFRVQQQNRIGLLRLLREVGGRDLEDVTLTCDRPPIVEGANRIWSACRIRTGDGELRLFGALLERGGRFKVLSFANDF